ncbi:hypothetical protein D3C85_1167040 [compost metagenome]
MKAAIGLQIARHIGDDRLAGLEYATIGQLQASFGVWPQVGGVDAFVDYLNLVLVGGRMQAVLPAGRGDGLVAVFQVEQVQGVAAADADGAVDVQRKFRIEAGIGALGLVVVLAEVNQLGVQEDVLGIEGFTPAGVGDYHVRAVALGLEIQQQA